MKYTIPVVYLDKLNKKLDHIKNKGGHVILNVGTERREPVFFEHNDPATHTVYKDLQPTYIKVVDVEVEGKYVVNGWEFVATIEHKTERNIIRAINNDYVIPDKYYTCGPACEHCHIVRDRKDTYLIYNKEKNEWKQVGKTCLQDFTGGLDAETCAAYSDLESYLINCRDLNNYEDTDFDYRNNNAFKNDTVKKIGYNLIKNNGYIKQDSIVQFMHNYKKDKYATKDEPANDEDIKKIDAWVNEKDKQTDYSNTYMTNAITAWKEEYIEYRDLALVLSLINSYFKDIQEQERNKHNSISTNYVGNIGDKVTLKIASYRFLYQKNNDTYSYYALPTSIYQVIDDKGNTFIVETSKESIDDDWINRTIEGKVKAQKEYKGIKQTIINRIKLLNETLSISEALKFLK